MTIFDRPYERSDENMEYYDGLIGDVGEPMAGVLPESGPGSRPRRSAMNLTEPSIPAMAAVARNYDDLPDEIWMPLAQKKLVILDDIAQGEWDKIQDIKRPMAPIKQFYQAQEEQPKVPNEADYDRCSQNMEFMKEFHDGRVEKPTPNQDLGKELEELSEHTKILPREDEDTIRFQRHVSKIRKYQFPVDCMVAKPMIKEAIRNDKTGKAQEAIRKEWNNLRAKGVWNDFTYESGKRS